MLEQALSLPTIAKKLLLLLFTVVYSTLLILVGIADNSARIYNNPDLGNGDGFNPIISPGNYSHPRNLPFLFPPNAYLALARQAATDGEIEDAKQYAYNALKINPTSGEAAQGLLDFYTRPNLYRISLQIFDQESGNHHFPPEPDFIIQSPSLQQFTDRLASINQTLRPVHIITQSSLADYWVNRGKPEKALHAWHIMLSQRPDTEEEIFPRLFANLHKSDMQEALKPYLNTPPKWWKRFLQYQLKHDKP